MFHWKKCIWPGILSIALLTVLALWARADLIEKDLTTKAGKALTESGNDWAKVVLDGRDALLTGEAPSEEQRSAATKLVENAYQVRVVADETTLAPLENPYKLEISKTDGAVSIEGFVPNSAARVAIGEELKQAFPQQTVDEKLSNARGAPDKFTDFVTFGIRQLNSLKTGKYSLSDGTFDLEGEAGDSATYETLLSELSGSMPTGLTSGNVNITAPVATPYTWSVANNGSSLIVDGYAPSREAADQIVASATASLPSVEVENRLRVASGTPEGFEKATEFSFNALADMASGEVMISDKKISISGLAKDSASYLNVSRYVGDSVPDGWVVAKSDIRPAAISPYTWNIKREGNQTEISGYVPNNETRESILDAARAKLGGEVKDNMQIALGAPDGFGDVTGFAIDRLAGLSAGSVSLSNNALEVVGTAASVDVYQAYTAGLGENIPAGFAVEKSDIQPASIKPYTWQADIADQNMVLAGHVPNEEAREAIVTSAGQMVGGTITDNMKIAAGAPSGFQAYAGFSLKQLAQLSTGKVSLSDTAMTIEGDTADTGKFDAVQAALNGALPSGLAVATRSVNPPPEVPDYKWSVERKADEIVLRGDMPDIRARGRLLTRSKALFDGSTIVNEMGIREDAPAGLISNIDRSLSLLGSLKRGRVSITNTQVDATGIASSVNGYAKASEMLEAEPTFGFSWGKRDVEPAEARPYTWSIRKNETGYVQTGFMPSKQRANALNQQLQAALNAPVENQTRIAAGAPEEFDTALKSVATAIADMDRASASIVDSLVSVRGHASSEEGAVKIRGDLAAALPGNYKLRTQITHPLPKIDIIKPTAKASASADAANTKETVEEVAQEKQEPAQDQAKEQAAVQEQEEAPKCTVDFKALFGGEKIRFATNKALINPVSDALLKRIADGAKSCPDSSFEIGGFTDSRGSANYNMQLSEARAEAVLFRLVEEGVDGTRLNAKGYGEELPIASNDTPEGRAINRRIEFKVLGQ